MLSKFKRLFRIAMWGMARQAGIYDYWLENGKYSVYEKWRNRYLAGMSRLFDGISDAQ